MRYLPGSHTEGKRNHADSYADKNLLHRGQTLAEPIEESAAVDIVLLPGQASLHHGWVFHASRANSSSDRRIGLTLQYLSPSVRQTVVVGEGATLVRGEDRYRHFQAEPEFKGDFQPEMLAFQQAAEDLKHSVYETDV